jgi:hypothetical protein
MLMFTLLNTCVLCIDWEQGFENQGMGRVKNPISCTPSITLYLASLNNEQVSKPFNIQTSVNCPINLFNGFKKVQSVSIRHSVPIQSQRPKTTQK